MYWAQALANQSNDSELKTMFSPVAKALTENETKIVDELNAVQGQTTNIGGYYLTEDDIESKVMRPSSTFNNIINSI